MLRDITLTDTPESFDGPNAALLPWNYLDIAMPEMIGRGSGRARLVMALPTAHAPARYSVIGADTLANPAATVDYIADLDGLGLDPAQLDRRCILGPEVDLKPYDPQSGTPPDVVEISAEPWNLIANRPVSRVVVVIDTGIAFWNPRFRGLTGPRFHGMRYLDFELPNAGQSNLLSGADIAALCAQADAEGSAAVMRKLGAKYPNSVYGRAANLDPDGLWHGTAIADLAAGAEPGTADDVALFGLELPRAVIADYSGQTLSAALAMILPAAIGMTAAFANKPLTIVMPLGFPAGPQDGTHPAAVSIDRALAAAGRANLRLVLPAGNHLQDRCHARLSEPGLPAQVHWDLPPEDYSMNVATLFGVLGQPFDLTIAAPGQAAPASATLSQMTYQYVVQDDQKVGVVLRGLDTPTASHAGIALWHTAETPNASGVPFGRWTLSSAFSLHLWLARDDRDMAADRGRPHRPSRFWDAAYTPTDRFGALMQMDDPGSAIHRTGTLSALATARSSRPVAVRAMERLGTGPVAPTGYSSQRADGLPVRAEALVDDGWPGRGSMAAANGGLRRKRVSGTSAAAGLYARSVALPNLPPGG